jgi:hypothetical protein
MSISVRTNPIRIITTLTGLWLLCSSTGCATIRVTDPPRTATEQFLLTNATKAAIDQLSLVPLQDRLVYVDWTFLTADKPAHEWAFLIAELRAKLMAQGVRVMSHRDEADIIVEIRSGGVGIDRTEFLIGIPALFVPAAASAVAADAPVSMATPELAIVKSTKQRGYASVAFIAYWRDSAELVFSSGPFIGRTYRDDFWLFGVGPKSVGDIPPAQR